MKAQKMINGSDFTVRVNGEIIGGVYRFVSKTLTETKEIREFLTDIPVTRIPSESYVLKFFLHCADDCVFENTPLESIAVCDGQKTEIYTLCAVRELAREVTPEGNAEYHVTVTAEERSVADA